MHLQTPSTRALRWLAPSEHAGGRRLMVAGVAGILLTAPLSLQEPIAPVRSWAGS